MIWILAIVAYLNSISGAKILGIFPVPAKSHFIYNDAIMRSLVAAGHEVTVISPFSQRSIANYTVIDMSKDSLVYVGRTAISELKDVKTWELIPLIMGLEEEYCYKYLELKEVKKILNSEVKFDVIILEVFFMYQCFLPLAAKLKVPIIGTASQRTWLFADHLISNPNNPSYIPSEFSCSWKIDSFRERIKNIWKTVLTYYAEFHIMPSKMEKFYQTYSNLVNYEHPDSQLFSLIFYNTHFSYYSRPMNPNAIEIGGIHIKEESPLPEIIEKFIQESENGVILFSLGSMIRGSTLDWSIKSAFLEAFAQIPQRVIWKHEDKMENVPENVLISEWIPQRDILAHKKVKAFISHCGQSGTYEAIYTGTPIVSLAVNGDQHTVASILENLGAAIQLKFTSLTKEIILETLNNIINDTRYFDNMQKLSQRFKDRPLSPQETVVYWTEYVIRHKGAYHLQSAALKLNWFQYFLLDVILFIIFTVTLIFCLIYCVIKIIIFYFTRNDNHHRVQKEWKTT